MARKSDLVDKISKELNYLSKEDIKDSIDLVFDYLQSSLAEQNRIEIRGFGSFSIRKRKFPNKVSGHIKLSIIVDIARLLEKGGNNSYPEFAFSCYTISQNQLPSLC